MPGPGDGWAGRGGRVIFLWPIFSYRSRCIRINLEVPAVSESKSETNWLRKSHKTILGFKTSGAVTVYFIFFEARLYVEKVYELNC